MLIEHSVDVPCDLIRRERIYAIMRCLSPDMRRFGGEDSANTQVDLLEWKAEPHSVKVKYNRRMTSLVLSHSPADDEGW
jgi:hypothetical protein